jgi:hypothetical protein
MAEAQPQPATPGTEDNPLEVELTPTEKAALDRAELEAAGDEDAIPVSERPHGPWPCAPDERRINRWAHEVLVTADGKRRLAIHCFNKGEVVLVDLPDKTTAELLEELAATLPGWKPKVKVETAQSLGPDIVRDGDQVLARGTNRQTGLRKRGEVQL